MDSTSKKIVFFGSPNYGAVILKQIVGKWNVAGVITQPDKRVGRGKKILAPPVKLAALEYNIPFIQPVKLNTEIVMQTLSVWKADIIIVAAYGKILKPEILQLPQFGCVNVHASLLPKWRGASPIQAAIIYGDRESGATIIKMDEGIDTGDMLAQKSIRISEKESAEALTAKLAKLGAFLLVDTLPAYFAGEIDLVKQDSDRASYAGLIKKEDGELDFNQTAVEIERRIRAYDPWPICFFNWDGRVVKIYRVEILRSRQLKPGERGIINKFPSVGTSTQDLQLSEIQLPGKKRVDGKAFLNGARGWLQN